MGTRIVLADDSLVFRKVMKQVVEETFDVEEIRLASSGAEALALIEESCPDLLFTDMEMPGMSGLELVDAVKRGGHACKMIVVSGVMNRSGIDLTVKALSAGAIAFIHKPEGGGFQASVDLLKESLGSALDGIRDSRAVTHVPATPAPPPRRPRPGRREWKFRVVVVAVSTGGPEALSRLIPALPEDFPLPILVVQHMPASFTPSFARNLDRRSALNVVEAEAGMTPHMERIMKAMNQDVPESKRILEVNGDHPVMARLKDLYDADKESGKAGDYVELLHALALLTEGSPVLDPARVNKLVTELMVAAG